MGNKKCHPWVATLREVETMKSKQQAGFSLIELLIVVVVIGIIAALAVPAYQRSKSAAENGSVIATMRVIEQTQVSFFSQNNRFGRLTEISNLAGRSLGEINSAGNLLRNNFTFSMVPASPTDDELKSGYTIVATRNVATDPVIYKFEVTQSGEIRQILPSVRAVGE